MRKAGTCNVLFYLQYRRGVWALRLGFRANGPALAWYWDLARARMGEGGLAPPDAGKAGVINNMAVFFDRRCFATGTRVGAYLQ